MHNLAHRAFLEMVLGSILCSFGDSPMKVSRTLHTTSAVAASLSLMQSVARCCFCALVYRECRGELPPAKAGEVAENELSVIFMASFQLEDMSFVPKVSKDNLSLQNPSRTRI